MTITTPQLASGLATLLGLSTGDATALSALFNDWDPTTPTDLATLVTDFVSASAVRDESYNDWWVGTATGGPTSDGYYPITVFGGGTISLPSPAKMQAELTGLTFRGSTATTTTLNAITGAATGDLWLVSASNRLYGRSSAGAWVDLGPAGVAATVGVGTVTTGAAGSSASVTNVGTSSAAVFNFTIPGGATGAAATVAVGNVTTGAAGSSASVTNAGTSGAAVLDFTIPRGATGTAATVAVGTVTTAAAGSSAAVTNAGTSSAAILNFAIPKGDRGDAATIEVGTVTTGAAGSSVSVTNAGTSSAAVFNFTIPRGATGPAPNLTIGTVSAGSSPSVTISGTSPNYTLDFTLQTGGAGAAASVSIGTVTTLSPGASATVTNVGTSSAAVLNFGIPQGAAGAGTGDMLAANNLSDLTNKPTALATLGGQASSAELTGVSALSSTGLVARTASGTYAARTLGAGAGLTWTNGNGVAGAPSIAIDPDVVQLKSDSLAASRLTGTIDVARLPATVINDTFEVGSQSAMLALTAQRGDIAIRSDENKAYVLSTDSPSTLADWKWLRTPPDAVLSVVGLTGAISQSALKAALAMSASDVSGLGTAATLNHGTAAGNLVRLDPSTGKLPAVDGSLLTNLPGGGGLELVATVNIAWGATGFSFGSTHINGTYEKYYIAGNCMSSSSMELRLALAQNGSLVSSHAYQSTLKRTNSHGYSIDSNNGGVSSIPMTTAGEIGGTYAWPLSFEMWLDAGKAGDNQSHSARIISRGRGDYAYCIFEVDVTALEYGNLSGVSVWMPDGSFQGGVARLYGFKKV